MDCESQKKDLILIQFILMKFIWKILDEKN